MFQVTRFDFGDASRDTTPLSARGDTPNGKEVGANDTQSMQLEELHRLAMARKQKQVSSKTKTSIKPSTGVPFDFTRTADLPRVADSGLQGGTKKRKDRRRTTLASRVPGELPSKQGVRPLNRRQRRRLAQQQEQQDMRNDSFAVVESRSLEENGNVFIRGSKDTDAPRVPHDKRFGQNSDRNGSSTLLHSAEMGAMSAASKKPPRALDQDAREWGIDPSIVSALQANGFSKFFPIQRCALPLVLRGDSRVSGLHEDVCVSAPTGSGKTMVYAVAAVQALINRVIPRLRALIILPARDLAIQVHDVFAKLCKTLPLRVAIAVTNHRTSFLAEQPLVTAADILVCTPGRLLDHVRSTPNFTLEHLQMLIVDEADRLLAQSYQSWVSAVLDSVRRSESRGFLSCPTKVPVDLRSSCGISGIATPAFTIVTSTPRGNQTHDAAQTSSLFAGRLRKLLFSATLTTDPQHIASLELVNPRFISLGNSTPNYAAHILAQSSPARRANSRGSSVFIIPHPTKGPKRVRMFRTPDSLKENVLLCDVQDKPQQLILLLKSLVAEHGDASRTLVFTRSVFSAHRLCRLLQLFEICEEEHAEGKILKEATKHGSLGQEMAADIGIHDQAQSLHERCSTTKVSEYSSSVPPKQRANTLRRFSRRGPFTDGNLCQVLVCSDAGSRGLDMEVVTSVVNYDAPTLAKAYVHRVGRTARAGRSGSCYTILQPGQQGGFHALMKQVEHNKVLVHRTFGGVDDARAVKDILPGALQSLKKVMELEEDEPAYRA